MRSKACVILMGNWTDIDLLNLYNSFVLSMFFFAQRGDGLCPSVKGGDLTKNNVDLKLLLMCHSAHKSRQRRIKIVSDS